MIVCSLHLPWYFFFQAEDGIRDATVTGVQTCALPIYPDVQCDLADLRLVEVPDRVDPRRHVAELCAVPEEELGLVARPDNDSVRPRAVVLDALALARHLVPNADPARNVAVVVREVCVDLFSDRDFLEPKAKHLRELPRVPPRFLARGAIRCEQTEHALGTESLGCERDGERAVDAARDADDRAFESRLRDLSADEEHDHLAHEHFVEPDRRGAFPVR